MERSKLVGRIVGGVAALGLGVQLVPYGRDHSNPPVTGEPQWDSPRTAELAQRACYDCHSNKTVWPWYSHIAPLSWMVQSHVDEARGKLNFTEMDKPQKDADEAADAVREGWMPPQYYVQLHSSARLSAAELSDLARGLEATLGSEGGEGAGAPGQQPVMDNDDDDD